MKLSKRVLVVALLIFAVAMYAGIMVKVARYGP
jgi:hypothetical protein